MKILNQQDIEQVSGGANPVVYVAGIAVVRCDMISASELAEMMSQYNSNTSIPPASGTMPV
ncbi:MAG: hypothetical protein V4582_22035 [Pseudomonadota bacterium]